MSQSADKMHILQTKPMTDCIIRDACPDDAPFLAKCIMAGMHFYDFETDIPAESEIYERLIECERRDDLLYSFRYTRVAEVGGVLAGSLLSYPGEIYREMRHKTFCELWPDLARMDAESEMETGPGEYYLDSLAVHPAYRRRGMGKALLLDGIRKGETLGYNRVALVADSAMPHLVRLYESIGFVPADHRHVFGVDFQRMVYEVKGEFQRPAALGYAHSKFSFPAPTSK